MRIAAALGLACASSWCGAAMAAPPLVVDLQEDAPVLDAAVLRDAIARELQLPVIAQESVGERSPKLTVRVDRGRGELTVEYAGGDPVGDAVVRHVALPTDAGEALRTAVFLAGNLARDEARDVLRDLRPAPSPPPESTERDTEPASNERESWSPTLWIGLSAEGDWTYLPSSSDPCRGVYQCVSVDPGAFPREPIGTLEGQIDGGLHPANARFLVSLDTAVMPNLLFGIRLGWVTATDPYVASNGTLRHLQIEARATYAFGDRPLARAGLAPIVEMGGGAAEHSASVKVTLYDSAAPQQPFEHDYSWRHAGPAFVSGGAGVRWAIRPRFALTALPLKATVAFGGGPPLYLFSPEIGVQFGW